jgi:hypothetical protein
MRHGSEQSVRQQRSAQLRFNMDRRRTYLGKGVRLDPTLDEIDRLSRAEKCPKRSVLSELLGELLPLPRVVELLLEILGHVGTGGGALEGLVGGSGRAEDDGEGVGFKVGESEREDPDCEGKGDGGVRY